MTSKFCDNKILELNKSRPPLSDDVLYAELVTFCILGITGNFMVLWVYGSETFRKKPSVILILALGVTDFVTCIITVPLTIALERYNYNIESDILCKVWFFAQTSMIPFSAFTMSTIAIERYLVICHPFQTYLDSRRTKIGIAVLAALAIFLGILVSLCHGTYQLCPEDRQFNQTDDNVNNYVTTLWPRESFYDQWMTNATNILMANVIESNPELYVKHTGICLPSSVILSPEIRKSYKYVHIAMYFISLSITVLLYIRIYVYVIFNRQRMRRLSSTGEHGGRRNSTSKSISQEIVNHIKTATMLTMVAVVFFLSFLAPTLQVLRVISLRKQRYLFYMLYFNNVANPIIYSFMNIKFRRAMTKKVFHYCPCQVRDRHTSEMVPFTTIRTIGFDEGETDPVHPDSGTKNNSVALQL